MKIRSMGYLVLLFGGICIVCSLGSRRLCAQQSHPSHVTVFAQSSAAPPATQQISPAREADIRQLMEVAGMKETVARMMSTMEQNMKPMFERSLPPGQYRERLVQLFFEKLHAKSDPDHILNLVLPVYARNLSDDDIKGLIRFYKTPLGRKWVSVQPKVQAEIAPAARSWGEQVGRQSMQEVLEEHPELEEQMKAAVEAQHQH